MKPLVIVNLLDQIEDPGPIPENPGEAPPVADPSFVGWYPKAREYGEWYKKNRRFQLAQLAKEIDKIPSGQKTCSDKAVVLLTAIVLEDALESAHSVLSMLGLT